MSERLVRQLAARMSLREPQGASLAILADLLGRIELGKAADVAAQLAVVRAQWPAVEDFERDFASVCIALATGVGKTRLMGAFVAYLYLTGRSRHFFVLAPNLTIYEKLKADFDPASPKYVLAGIPEFATTPPVLVTGENYESGAGVRYEDVRAMTVPGQLFGAEQLPHINIFNIAKINTEVRGGSAPRMKRLQEYIGDSYFDYLAGLDDLVLLMDEAHRYRASAGAKAIAELKPILGIELTATPKSVGANSKAFRNVIYRYGLGEALADGLLKEPAVATRKDFNPAGVPDDELERIKLEDGIHYHEYVKVELATYARQSGRALVKPFMLVVAQDTAHASRIRALMESDGFFGGAYRGAVIEVHSAQSGVESDEAMARLLAVETDETTQVVIHVNKLKEGWDVTNLFTIVPLRASASDILTEQTLGRGLRLPYGRRTGVAAVDRLTIIAHDQFQRIIDEAGKPDAIISEQLTIGPGGDVPTQAPQAGVARSVVESVLTGSASTVGMKAVPAAVAGDAAAYRTDVAGEQQIARVAWKAIQRLESRLPSADALTNPDVRARIRAEVEAEIAPAQATLGLEEQGQTLAVAVERVVNRATEAVARLTIDIPNVVVIPTREVAFGYRDFNLEDLGRLSYRPVDEELVVQQLRDRAREHIGWDRRDLREPRPENYLVGVLMERDEIDYEAHAELLYKLSGQVVARLRGHLPDDTAVENVLIYHRRALAAFIWAQMAARRWETPTGYQGRVTRGFTMLRPLAFTLPPGAVPRDFRQPLPAGTNIRQVVFAGFTKCCYDLQQFQSAEGEQRLAILLEDDIDVVRWLKPGPGQFQIEWKNGRSYEPDFVVETKTEKLILEPKRATDIAEPDVQAKAQAAARWCEHATEHALAHASKPWRYALIPHDAIVGGGTAVGLANAYAIRPSTPSTQ